MKILKKKYIAGIYSIYNCAKFQHVCAILTSLGCPGSFDSKLQQTKTNTQKNEGTPNAFPTIYILLSYETMIRHLTLTAFASAAIIYIL